MTVLGDGGQATTQTSTDATQQTTQQSTQQTSQTSQQTSWKDSLPEDLRGHGALNNFQSVSDLAKSFVHAQERISKKGVIPPTDKSTDEEWSSFYNSIGRPELDKYELAVGDRPGLRKETVEEFKKVAHKVGLLPKQAQALMEWQMAGEEQIMKTAQESAKAKAAEAVDGLKKEWGEGFNKQIEYARTAVRELGGEEFQAYLEESGLGNDPKIIKILNKAGKLLGEDKLRGDGSGKFGQTPGEIQGEIDKMMADTKGPYWDSTHAGHANAVKQMENLYRKLAGG